MQRKAKKINKLKDKKGEIMAEYLDVLGKKCGECGDVQYECTKCGTPRESFEQNGAHYTCPGCESVANFTRIFGKLTKKDDNAYCTCSKCTRMAA